MFESEYNQEAITATNRHAFGTVSAEWVKFLDTLSSESLAQKTTVETLEEI